MGYLVLNTFFFGSTRMRAKCCCKVNFGIAQGVYLGLTTAMLSLCAVNFGLIYPKYEALRQWAEYEDSVDQYMKVTEYQLGIITTCSGALVGQLVMALLAATITLITFIWQMCLFCR